jgi:phosphatidate cytidylyltransferase
MRYNYMICPVRDLGKTAFSEIHCRPNPVFEWREIALPGFVTNALKTAVGRLRLLGCNSADSKDAVAP